MKNLLNRRGMRWLLASGITALLVSCVGLLLLRDSAVAQDSVELAKTRWAARNFDAYTLMLRQETRNKICDQQIEARGEQVVLAVHNSCGQPPTWTVTRLLNWIVELEREPSRCYPSTADCACQVMMNTHVTYDSQLGYPRQIIYEWHSQPNLLNPSYWRMLTDKTFPGCSNIQGSGPGGTLVVNVGLTPEP